MPNSLPLPITSDPEIGTVVAEIQRLDRYGERTAGVLRSSLDQLYDGERTGRFRWDQLFKTERMHCGALLGINLQRHFRFQDGLTLDYRIGEVETRCLFSPEPNGWTLSPEMAEEVCLLLWADDQASKWGIGIIRAKEQFLTATTNGNLNAIGRDAITWIFKERDLAPNILLRHDGALIDHIVRVGGAAVATIARRSDYQSLVQKARTNLQPDGIVLLGQYLSHCAIALALGIEPPGPGESIAVRLTPATPGEKGSAEIDGRSWKIAKASDPIVRAPKLPRIERTRATTTSRRTPESS